MSISDIHGLPLATLPAASVGLLPTLVLYNLFCTVASFKSFQLCHFAPGLVEFAVLPMLILCLRSPRCVITLYLGLLSDKLLGPTISLLALEST